MHTHNEKSRILSHYQFCSIHIFKWKLLRVWMLCQLLSLLWRSSLLTEMLWQMISCLLRKLSVFEAVRQKVDLCLLLIFFIYKNVLAMLATGFWGWQCRWSVSPQIWSGLDSIYQRNWSSTFPSELIVITLVVLFFLFFCPVLCTSWPNTCRTKDIPLSLS